MCSITSMLLVVFEVLEGIDRLNTKYSNWSPFFLGHENWKPWKSPFDPISSVWPRMTHSHWCWKGQETVGLKVLDVSPLTDVELAHDTNGPMNRGTDAMPVRWHQGNLSIQPGEVHYCLLSCLSFPPAIGVLPQKWPNKLKQRDKSKAKPEDQNGRISRP